MHPSLTISASGLSLATATPTPLDLRLQQYEQLEAKNRATGRLRREIADELAKEDLPEGVFAPICLATPHTTPPHSYTLHNHRQVCTGCSRENRWTDLFAVYHLRSRNGSGKYIRNMQPCSRIEWNVPIHSHNLKTRITPFCFHCSNRAAAIATTCPRPPIPQLTTLPDAIVSHTPASQARKGGASVASQRKKTPTLDDIL